MHQEGQSQPLTTGNTLPGLAPFYDIVTTILSLGRERQFRQAVLDVADLEPGDSVLDVGCGTGTLALLAREQLGPRSTIHGIDATPQMIERARRKARRQDRDVTFEVGVIEALAYSGNTFDAVLSTLMMHHLPADVQVRGIAEIGRVLRPGGRVVIADFSQSEPSLTTLIHGPEPGSEDRVDAFTRLLENASFRHVRTGPLPMRGIFYVTGVKPNLS